MSKQTYFNIMLCIVGVLGIATIGLMLSFAIGWRPFDVIDQGNFIAEVMSLIVEATIFATLLGYFVPERLRIIQEQNALKGYGPGRAKVYAEVQQVRNEALSSVATLFNMRQPDAWNERLGEGKKHFDRRRLPPLVEMGPRGRRTKDRGNAVKRVFNLTKTAKFNLNRQKDKIERLVFYSAGFQSPQLATTLEETAAWLNALEVFVDEELESEIYKYWLVLNHAFGLERERTAGSFPDHDYFMVRLSDGALVDLPYSTDPQDVEPALQIVQHWTDEKLDEAVAPLKDCLGSLNKLLKPESWPSISSDMPEGAHSIELIDASVKRADQLQRDYEQRLGDGFLIPLFVVLSKDRFLPD